MLPGFSVNYQYVAFLQLEPEPRLTTLWVWLGQNQEMKVNAVDHCL